MRWLTNIVLLAVMVTGTASADDPVPTYRAGASDLKATELAVGDNQFQALLAQGLELETLTTGLRGPRIIHFFGDRMLIGSKSGDIYLLDPPYQQAKVLTSLDGYPHSIVILKGKIYVARTADILVAEFDGVSRIRPDDFRTLVKLPGGRGHSSRTLKIGPDQRLYVSLGIAGNCSDQWLNNDYKFENRRGGLFVLDQDGNKASLVPYASGLRNPIGYDWRPESGELFAVNHGPDHLGFDQPPEQMVRIEAGSFHGMPWFQHDGEGFFRDSCVSSTPPAAIESIAEPVALFPARNGPMDLAFPGSRSHPYFGDAIVALHGSWATADASGGAGSPGTRRPPGLVRVEFNGDQAIAVHDVLRGLQLEDGRRWMRPAGVAVGPDGYIYFTSDGGIHGLYRLRHEQ